MIAVMPTTALQTVVRVVVTVLMTVLEMVVWMVLEIDFKRFQIELPSLQLFGSRTHLADLVQPTNGHHPSPRQCQLAVGAN